MIFDIDHWKPYQPSPAQPWNLPRVWMLHRRAGFGATWQQIRRDLKDGHAKSTARVLEGKSRDAVDPQFESNSEFLLKRAATQGQITGLSAWWILRMYMGPDAFAERRTLMWHNHFATSDRTIQNPRRLSLQNKILREHGKGNFKELLEQAIKNPTMLLWLNANDNRQGHPNENLGRELLELFSLGIGNYTENDVKEAARALTGWTANPMMQANGENLFSDPKADRMTVRDHWHDSFNKTILGKTGPWNGDDLLRLVLEHPATAQRLAWRICDEFLGENVVSQPALDELAAGLRKNDLNLQWAYETVLNSELFYSDKNLKSKIAAPETFVLGNLIALHTHNTPASTLALVNLLTRLGRSLFQPPNVGGWEGGRLWLNARTLVARTNFVHNVINNGMNRTSTPPDFDAIAGMFENQDKLSSVVTQLAELLLGIDRESASDQAIITKLVTEAEKQPADRRWAHVCHLLLSTSSAQLC